MTVFSFILTYIFPYNSFQDEVMGIDVDNLYLNTGFANFSFNNLG